MMIATGKHQRATYICVKATTVRAASSQDDAAGINFHRAAVAQRHVKSGVRACSLAHQAPVRERSWTIYVPASGDGETCTGKIIDCSTGTKNTKVNSIRTGPGRGAADIQRFAVDVDSRSRRGIDLQAAANVDSTRAAQMPARAPKHLSRDRNGVAAT